MKGVRQEIGGLGNLLFKEAYIWAQMRDGNIPDIYVQSSKYWEKYREEIRQRFSSGITDKGIPFVAVHIRRGDYLKATQFHVPLWETDYYQKALGQFPNEKFMVFCRDNQSPEIDKEDRRWCREFMYSLVGDRFVMLSDDSKETEDLNMMASCKSLIGANSSFAWWAAFLGNHERVMFPQKWFTDGIQRTELLPNWELL